MAGLLVASKVIAIARTCAKAAMYGKMRAAIAIVLAFGLTSAIAGPTVVQSVKEMKLRLTAPVDLTKIVRPLLRMIAPELRAEKTEEKKAEVVVVPAPPAQNEVKLTVPPVEPLRVVDSSSATAQATGGGGAANAGGSSAAPAPVEVVRRNPIEDIEEFLRIAPAPRESAPLPVGGGGGGGSISLADARGNRTSAQAQAEGAGETTAATPPIDVSTGRMTLGGGGGTPMNFELASEQTVHTKGSVIGDTGFGHFRQSKGRHKVDGDLVLGNEPGSKGVYEMTGGSVEAGGLVVGNKGEGLFSQFGGWTSADNIAIAKEEGSVGTYILDGESSLRGGKITVAVRGTGTLDNRGGEITLSAGESSYSSALWYSEAQEPATLNVAQDATANGNLVMRSGRLLFQSGQYNPQLRVGVGGDGTLTLGGDGGSDLVQIAEEKSSVKTNLVVRAYASGRGVLKGHGDVFLTGTLFMNGKVLADGFNVERTLDLSHFSKVDNRIENPIEGGTNGWVARRKGALLLPPVPVKRGTDTYNWGEAETDKNIDLVNSVRFTAHDAQYPGEVNISLLSTDRSDIPTLPGAHRFLSVWSFDPSDIEAEGGFDITVRYNDVLAKSLGIEETLLKFWAYNGSWVRINDESFHRDLTKNLIGGAF